MLGMFLTRLFHLGGWSHHSDRLLDLNAAKRRKNLFSLFFRKAWEIKGYIEKGQGGEALVCFGGRRFQ